MREPDDSPLASSLIFQHSARNPRCARSRGASFFLLPSSFFLFLLLLPVTRARRVYVHTGVNIARRVASSPPHSQQEGKFVRRRFLGRSRPSGPATTRSRKRESQRLEKNRHKAREPFSTRLCACFRVSAAPATSTSPGCMCGRLPYLLRPSNKPQTSSRGKRWHGIWLGWKGYSWEILRGNSPLSSGSREISFR